MSDLSQLKDLKRFVRSHGVKARVSWSTSLGPEVVGNASWLLWPDTGRYKFTNIRFNSVVWPMMTRDQRFMTLAHETAHAMLHPDVHHGEKWVDLCIALGGNGRITAW